MNQPTKTEAERKLEVVTAIKRLGVAHPEYDTEKMLEDFEDFYAECPRAEAAYGYVLNNGSAYKRKP